MKITTREIGYGPWRPSFAVAFDAAHDTRADLPDISVVFARSAAALHQLRVDLLLSELG